MSTLAAVIVGALAAGIPTTTLALLQRRWAVKDAEKAWKREQRERILERKQEAHLAFLDTVHATDHAISHHTADMMDTLNSVTHMRAKLEAYASQESLDHGTEVARALVRWARAVHEGEKATTLGGAAYHAELRYVRALRLDLGIDDDDPLTQRAIRSTLASEKPNELS